MNLKLNAILTLSILLACLAAAKAQENNNVHTYGSGQELIRSNYDGHDYLISVSGSSAKLLCVDNKKVGTADLPKYDSLIRRIVAEVRADEAQGERDREQGARDREQGERDRAQGELDRQQGERDREQGERDRRQAEEDRRQMKELVDLLVQKKLIPAATSLRILFLNDEELVINGAKASPGIHKEIKEKFSKWAHLGLSYGNCAGCCTTIHFGPVSGD